MDAKPDLPFTEEMRNAHPEGMAPEEFALPAYLFAITRGAHTSRALLKCVLDQMELDLSPEEGMTLAVLTRFDRKSVQDVAEILQRDRTTITRLLDGLEEKGYIRREVNTADRRQLQVLPTPQAFAFEHRFRERASATFPQVMGDLRSEDVLSAVRLIEVLSQRMQSLIEASLNSDG